MKQGRLTFISLSLLLVISLLLTAGCQESRSSWKPSAELEAYMAKIPASPAPQLQSMLEEIFTIDYYAGVPMPQGMQDNDGGIVDGYLVMATGFCHGYDDKLKPGKYPRGFLRKVWALKLDDQEKGWIELPSIPGAARQETQAISVNNELYLWGGFSYSEPYCYKDGYKLSHKNGKWSWSKLPDLPHPLGGGSIQSIGDKIYLFGGFDYDKKALYVFNDRNDKIKRQGSRLYVFDTKNPSVGWNQLTQCPGTPRFMTGFAEINFELYAIGGYSVTPKGTAASVVDCWKYTPETDSWSRLRDLPVSVSGFGTGKTAYQNRYILLPTGYPHGEIANTDGTTRPRYGKPSHTDRSQWAHLTPDGTWDTMPMSSPYENHVWVYDTWTDLYGTATYLPFDDHAQAAHIIGDTLFYFPGETSGFYWEGEYFGHAPEFVLKGDITVNDWSGK